MDSKIDDKNPCIDCISLPICKGIMTSTKFKFFSTKLNNIMSRCPLFIEYIYNGRDEEMFVQPFTISIHNKRLIELVTYLGNTSSIEELIERDRQGKLLAIQFVHNMFRDYKK